MCSSRSLRFINILIRLCNTVRNFIINAKPAEQKVELSSLILCYGVSLPLSAFLYWRLFIDHFGKDYFNYCFSLEDVPFIIYDKGTYVWYVVLLLSFPCILFFMWKDSSIIKSVVASALVGIGIYTLTTIGNFSFWQIVSYIVLLVISNLFIFYYNRNTLYVYTIFIGLFFVSSAQNDAITAIKHPKRMTIKLKSGKVFLDQNDSSKIYVGSTSKFILVYDKIKRILDKKERDSIF